ncbi:hypothetical protein ACUN8C_14755 [Kushneria sp. Sum13]|uniref:hypothetical protein n=1 Tax=Kushneria sp. Sum13 TaxID=3459196 RepID=UPI004045E51D
MHQFDELSYLCTQFTLNSLREINEITISRLEKSAGTVDVKVLQMIRMQKVVLAVGVFSMFEASVQESFDCKNGFSYVRSTLEEKGSFDLKEKFEYFSLAVNALKHGEGKSYESLVKKKDKLPFLIKASDEYFFNEGDVSEINILIDVDDQFVIDCCDLIRDISRVLY